MNIAALVQLLECYVCLLVSRNRLVHWWEPAAAVVATVLVISVTTVDIVDVTHGVVAAATIVV